MDTLAGSFPADAIPEAQPGPGGHRLRWVVSLWLVFHVAAIVIAPASVSPSSGLVRSAWALVHPYLQVLT